MCKLSCLFTELPGSTESRIKRAVPVAFVRQCFLVLRKKLWALDLMQHSVVSAACCVLAGKLHLQILGSQVLVLLTSLRAAVTYWWCFWAPLIIRLCNKFTDHHTAPGFWKVTASLASSLVPSLLAKPMSWRVNRGPIFFLCCDWCLLKQYFSVSWVYSWNTPHQSWGTLLLAQCVIRVIMESISTKGRKFSLKKTHTVAFPMTQHSFFLVLQI